eukprot:CAMPEP_0180713362 /NCGR_PEP_ID=MMETSP1038_2-20121128/11854_1 /TAXON_ID=632150 /ORGANISM="Azadinium spinosum, Strain 3D9" /LENGTH=43 /DNA_ID= /DNA_START= /DNA_END= /DNA_ORIENTATION=
MKGGGNWALPARLSSPDVDVLYFKLIRALSSQPPSASQVCMSS